MSKDFYDDTKTHVFDEVTANCFLRSGMVQRYHSNPWLARFGQTNAQHQWGVAAIILRYHPEPSAELLREAILHDSGELGAADVAGPVKAANPKIGEVLKPLEYATRLKIGLRPAKLTEEDQEWLSFADGAECICFVRMHNPAVLEQESWRRFIKYLEVKAEGLSISRLCALELLHNA